MEIKMPIKFHGNYVVSIRCGAEENRERCQKLTMRALSAEEREQSYRSKGVDESVMPTHQITFYDFGCKRPTFSNDYFKAFTRDNVFLETTPIERIEADGIVTSDGTKTEIDTLVLATGFNLWDVNFPAIEVIGREGRNLGKWWRDNRFQAYEGVAVPYFPNFLTLASPYSYSGLSYFTTIESQMKHMKRIFGEVKRREGSTFEVTGQANTEFLDRMTARLGDSVFALGSCSTARSYYFNQHGEAAILRPTSTINAFREASRFPLDAYNYA